MAVRGEFITNEEVPPYLRMRLAAGRAEETLALYRDTGTMLFTGVFSDFSRSIWSDQPTPQMVTDAAKLFEFGSMDQLQEEMGSIKLMFDELGDGHYLTPELTDQAIEIAHSYRRYASAMRFSKHK